MNAVTNKLSVLLFIFVVAAFFPGCQQTPQTLPRWTGADSLRIIQEVLAHRAEVDSTFRNDMESPFRKDSSLHFDGLKWFPPDVNYYFESKLYRYERPETVSVFGTKGEERREVRYGYFILYFEGGKYQLNVYKFAPSDESYSTYGDLLSVWFTDETTGKETYHVGRYLDVGDEQHDQNHVYVLNFNNAFNPYCAYSPNYSCAIPPKEDHLNFPIRAGERNYH
jgi:uncharacterized protein (DUF1684 family)